MDVSQMMRGILGQIHTSDVKPLELKAGQIVRGIVLQMLENSEAVLQIEGYPVKAKLETPLKAGQTTMLQVQPDSREDLIIFKPLERSTAPIENKSLEQLLRSWNIPVDRQYKAAVQLFQQQGLPLSKENMTPMLALVSQAPKHVNMGQWHQAIATAWQRGLPLTVETVGALRQVMFGPSPTNLMQHLHQQLAQWLGKEELSLKQPSSQGSAVPNQVQQTSGMSPAGQETAFKLMRLLSTIIQTNSSEQDVLPKSGIVSSNVTSTVQKDVGMINSTKTTQLSSSSSQSSNHTQPLPLQSEALMHSALAKSEGDKGLNEQLKSPASDARSTEGNQETSPLQEQSEFLRKKEPSSSSRNGSEASMQNSAEAFNGADKIQKWLEQSGIHHERDTWKLLLKGMLQSAVQDPSELESGRVLTASQDPISNTQDTAKSLLMQLMSLDDLPSSIRESSQQLLQHITGQQLLLAPEKGNVFTHMTFHLPFGEGNQVQDVKVTLQSRTSGRGEVDGENCRLLFDLELEQMGHTIVDVHVVNKYVQLRVFNDHPELENWLELEQQSLSSGLENLGYGLTSISQAPYPLQRQNDPAPNPITNDEFITKRQVQYHAPQYKGLDLKI